MKILSPVVIWRMSIWKDMVGLSYLITSSDVGCPTGSRLLSIVFYQLSVQGCDFVGTSHSGCHQSILEGPVIAALPLLRPPQIALPQRLSGPGSGSGRTPPESQKANNLTVMATDSPFKKISPTQVNRESIFKASVPCTAFESRFFKRSFQHLNAALVISPLNCCNS